MEDRLIFASEARKAVLKADPKLAYVIDRVPGVKYGHWLECGDIERKAELKTFIVDVEPVKRGRWDEDGFCTNCGKEALTEWNDCGGELALSPYCPHCGAKMDLEGSLHD